MTTEKLNPDKYLTPQEIADYLRMNVKSVREYFIKGRRVRYLQVGHKYLILKSSFLDWEETHCTHVVNRWR